MSLLYLDYWHQSTVDIASIHHIEKEGVKNIKGKKTAAALSNK